MQFYKVSNLTSGLVFIIIIMMSIFFQCGKDSKNPLKDDDIKNTFTKPYDPSKVITMDDGLKVVGNNILIRFKDNVDTESAELIITNSGGELVGQIPALNIYQAEYEFPDETTLKAKITELSNLQDVELATYNSFSEKRATFVTKEYCARDYDNHKLPDEQRYAYEEIDYYTAVPIMGYVREKMSLNTVKVAVFDCKIEQNQTKEFGDIDIIVAEEENVSPIINTSHGTMVAGIIAADNKDGGMNGIASSLIGKKLKLYSYENTEVSAIEDIELIFLACSMDNVDVINMSYGYGGFIRDTNTPRNCVGTRSLYKWAFQSFPDVLFVCAAANQNFEISTTNDAPAGIQLSNVITVSGTLFSEPTRACGWCSYGSLIDIAGPNEKLALVDSSRGNAYILENGNSFSTPMVVAAAAVLKSINPDLTPGKIKKYLTDYAYSTDPIVSGCRLNLSLPIEQVLIDMHAPAEVLDKIDLVQPVNEGDAPGVVECRICAYSKIQIGGEDFMQCETDSTNLGVITAEGGPLTFATENQSFILGLNTYKILDGEMPIVSEDNADIQGAVVTSYINIENMHMGSSLSGKIKIDHANITQRNPINNTPMVINIEGQFSGAMEMLIDGEFSTRAFGGTINMAIIIFTENTAVYDYFEEKCDN